VEFDSALQHGILSEGSWIHFIGDFGTDAASGALYLSGTIQDISVRKRIEEQVNQLSMVAKLTTNGVIITDRNRVITWVNEGMSRLTGYTSEEMIGRTPKMFQSDRTSITVRKEIAENLARNRSVKVELENINKQGDHYWIELHIEPITDAVGTVSRSILLNANGMKMNCRMRSKRPLS
jgi:PAS domain S-box-containing protein